MSLSLSDLEIISVLKNQNRGLSARRLSHVIQTHYALSYTPSLSVTDLRRLATRHPEVIEAKKGVFFWDEHISTSNSTLSDQISEERYERGKSLLRASVRKKQRSAPYLPPPSLSQARLSTFFSPYPASPPSILDIENTRIDLGNSDFAYVFCKQFQENIDELAQYFQLPLRHLSRTPKKHRKQIEEIDVRQENTDVQREDMGIHPEDTSIHSPEDTSVHPPEDTIEQQENTRLSNIDSDQTLPLSPSSSSLSFPSSDSLLDQIQSQLNIHFYQNALPSLLSLSFSSFLNLIKPILSHLNYGQLEFLDQKKDQALLNAYHPQYQETLVFIKQSDLPLSIQTARKIEETLDDFQAQHLLMINLGGFDFDLKNDFNCIQGLDLHLLLELMIRHQIGITHHHVSYYSLDPVYFEHHGEGEG